MPLFEQVGSNLKTVEQRNFETENALQEMIQENLDAVFKCRFVASEFSTGAQHGRRIDTLALSEDNNPVIIEYKRVESSELINQSLFYLAWIRDHKGDFEIAVQKALGSSTEVDWSGVRVICIAPNFRKYDLHAVQVMGANLELWSYRLYRNDCLYLEEVFQKLIGQSISRPDRWGGPDARYARSPEWRESFEGWRGAARRWATAIRLRPGPATPTRVSRGPRDAESSRTDRARAGAGEWREVVRALNR